MDKNDAEDETLHAFLCPIGQTRMSDPVVLENGQTYDREAIETWFEKHDTDPLTGVAVKKRKVPNFAIKSAIAEYDVQLEVAKRTKKEHEMCEQQRNTQQELLLQWCDELFQSKRNLDDDSEYAHTMQRWYAVFRSCNGDVNDLGRLFERHVESILAVDWKRAAAIVRVLQLQPLPIRLIQMVDLYAEERSTKLSIDEWIQKHSYLQSCNRAWWNSDPWCFETVRRVLEIWINQSDVFSTSLARKANDLLGGNSKPKRRELQQLVPLYEFIQEKDIFERHYQLCLANRLINGFSWSLKLEREVIAMFREAAGFQWCNKLQGMVSDSENTRTHANLQVHVCKSGVWPTTAKIPYFAPPELSKTMCDFKRIWMQEHPGCKLFWHMDKGRAEVSLKGKDSVEYTLIVTTYQMMILLVFNRARRVTFQQILDAMGVPKSEMSHHLLSLVHPKVAIVLKRPNNKVLEPDHQFMLNPKYENTHRRVVVPLMQPLGDVDEDDDLKQRRIEQQRQIDSSICCIMMSRGRVQHPFLVAEVISRLKCRFVPKPAMIKKRIEALIQQEYIERDPADRSVYRYCR